MRNREAAPSALEVLYDQPPVAMLGGVFDAEEDGGNVEQPRVQFDLDPALSQQLEEAPLVLLPARFPLSVGVQEVPRRCEKRLGDVFRTAQLSEEKWKIAAFGEARKL